jgi:hypothetical protein
MARERMPFTPPEPLHAAETLPHSLGFRRAKTLRMLALLLAEPGVVRSTDQLAMAMSVSPCSVRTYVHYLRGWLAEQGVPDGLECRCGEGYRVPTDVAADLLDRLPCLVTATFLARAQMHFLRPPRPVCCAPDSAATTAADPFPVSVHRGHEMNFMQDLSPRRT